MKILKSIILLIWFLLPSIIFLSSCTSPQFVKTSEVNFDKDGPFEKVLLTNGELIEFSSEFGDASTIRKDTLIGITNNGIIRKVLLRNIQEVEVRKADTGNTLLLVGALAIGVILIGVVVYLSGEFHFSVWGKGMKF